MKTKKSIEIEEYDKSDICQRIATMLQASREIFEGTRMKVNSVLLSATEESEMIKNPQFVNAAEYGENKIILEGEIVCYLGVSIIVKWCKECKRSI